MPLIVVITEMKELFFYGMKKISLIARKEKKKILKLT